MQVFHDAQHRDVAQVDAVEEAEDEHDPQRQSEMQVDFTHQLPLLVDVVHVIAVCFGRVDLLHHDILLDHVRREV